MLPADLGVAVLSHVVEGTGFSGLQQNQLLMGAWALELLASRIDNHDLGIPANPRIEMVESQWIEGTSLRKTNRAGVARASSDSSRGRFYQDSTFTNNKRLDLFITHITSETNTLWMDQGEGNWIDMTAQAIEHRAIQVERPPVDVDWSLGREIDQTGRVGDATLVMKRNGWRLRSATPRWS